MNTYNNRFFHEISSGSIASAEIVAPMVTQLLGGPTYVKSVVDVGGGQGWWAKAFLDSGVEEALLIDGAYVTDPVVPFIPHDISISLPPLDKKYDLAVCLEVAEHLDVSRADTFISDLTSYSDVILFSAAIPFQTGTHHVNCQWPSYWLKKFQNHGFGVEDAIRPTIWTNTNIEVWYRQNIMIFSKDAYDDPVPTMLDVVHPELHYWGRV